MKLAQLFSIIVCICCSFSLQGQELYYHGGTGDKIELHPDRTNMIVYFNQKVDAREAFRITHPEFVSFDDTLFHQKNFAVLHFNKEQELPVEEVLQKVGEIFASVKSVSWGLQAQNGAKLWLDHRIAYMPHPEAFDQLIFDEILADFQGVKAGYTLTNRPIISVSDIADVMSLANRLFEAGIVKYAHPDFKSRARTQTVTPSDPLYGNQYYLHNDGTNINFGQNTNDNDIDAPEAWCITTGTNAITVAVVDEGVEAHEDLETSSNVSRVLTGFSANDAMGVGAPEAVADAHGQAIAGIIGASHNTIGVSGIAPHCEILPIHVFTDVISNTTQFADAINWAYSNGADVINNSWAFDFSAALGFYPNIESEITDAATLGRGGKGCVLTFSAGQGLNGNPGSSTVAYPSNVPEGLSVGVSTGTGVKPNYTNYGTGLDMVGVSSPDNVANITIMDRMGDLGYNNSSNYMMNLDFSNTNYSKWYGGTSSTAAQVAGVAALMLSLDPTLTASEVRSMLTSSADNIGSTTNFGNGRLNANAALIAVQNNTSFPVELIGFRGEAHEEAISLSWETASELNNDKFIIEKMDGYAFKALGEIKGAGNSQSLQTYSFSDAQPEFGKNVYRLRQLDFDGRSSFSAIVEIWFSQDGLEGISSVYPNPSHGDFSIHISGLQNETLSIQVSDINGKIIHAEMLSVMEQESSWSLANKQLASGLYSIRFADQYGHIALRKVVVK